MKDELKEIAKTRVAWFLLGLFVSGHNLTDGLVILKTLAGF